jgi:hypothetical protein
VHGLVVPCGSVSALSAAIERAILERDATAGRVVRARRRVETTLSFDQRLAVVESIYGELAARHAGPMDRPIEECA